MSFSPRMLFSIAAPAAIVVWAGCAAPHIDPLSAAQGNARVLAQGLDVSMFTPRPERLASLPLGRLVQPTRDS